MRSPHQRSGGGGQASGRSCGGGGGGECRSECSKGPKPLPRSTCLTSQVGSGTANAQFLQSSRPWDVLFIAESSPPLRSLEWLSLGWIEALAPPPPTPTLNSLVPRGMPGVGVCCELSTWRVLYFPVALMTI